MYTGNVLSANRIDSIISNISLAEGIAENSPGVGSCLQNVL